VIEKTLQHEGEQVREFYAALPHPARAKIKITQAVHRCTQDKKPALLGRAGPAPWLYVMERANGYNKILVRNSH
jgi:hypothetical protein